MKTKHTGKLMLAVALLLCIFASAATAAELKPGLNVITGTADAYDFEGDNSAVVFSTVQGTDASGNITSAVVTKAHGDDTDNKAASVAGGGGHVYIDIDYPTIEMTRPVKVTFDYILGIGGSQVRYLINFPNQFTNYEPATFFISYLGEQTTETWRTASFSRSAESLYNFNGQTSFYQGGADITGHAWVNYSGKAQASYFDNLSVIPAYKLNYDVNGGFGSVTPGYTFDTTYSTLDDGSNLLNSGYTFKGWSLTKDGTTAVSSVTFTPGSDATVYAIWEEGGDDSQKVVELYDGDTLRTYYVVANGKNRVLPELETNADGDILKGWKTADGNTIYGYNIPVVTDNLKLYSVYDSWETKPGINMFENGDFEADGLIDVRASNGRLSIVSDTDGNKMLEYERGSGYASIQHPVTWEHGRKYRVSYRFKADYSASTAVNFRYDEGANHLTGQQTLTANEWYSYTKDYVYNNEDHVAHTYDAINIYYNPNSEGKGGTVYYDDLVFTPYYKVTYYANGGTGAPAEEYFLADSYTVSDAVPVRAGFLFKGWSTKNGSVNAVTEVVPTPGEDIELYAIWESIAAQDAIVYDFTSDVPGVANGTIAVIAPEEVAAYTSIEVYHADNDGILAGYTPFATMTIESGAAAYAVTGNRAFPAGTTRLALVFKADGLDDITYWYTIPEEHRFDAENHELKYSFWATSDSHLGGTSYNSDYWSEMTVNRKNAMKDIFASDADFMFINGDVANYGTEPYAKVLRTYLDDVLNNTSHNVNNIPVFLVNGNHEYMNTNNANGGFDFDPIQQPFYEQIEYIKENYPDIKITHDGESIWFAAEIMGAKFIFLSSPEETADGNKHTYTMSDGQLKFLDEQLYESEYSNKTAFVVTHVPLEETYKQNGVWEDGITNSEKVREILAKHPNAVFCTGHTHSEIAYEGEHFVGVGDMTTEFSHLNDGCLVWISAYDKVGEDGSGHTKSYSTGMYIEVYNDMVIVKSRKFLDESVYFGHATYIIPTQDSNVEVAKAEIVGIPADGVTLEAVIDNPENYTYEWIVAGETVSTEKTWTIENNSEFAGEYVYLRAIDEKGYYATAKSAEPFSGVTITYDANGGSGAPAAVKAFAGEYTVNNSTFPKKDGAFFIGWATEADATKPVATVNVTEDITLYAVYTDEPKFYFDAHISGFVPNSYTSSAAVIDGNLVTVAVSGDQYYTWQGGTFAAADYPYIRIKAAIDGSGDGVFFKSDAGGFAESRHLLFSQATVAAEFDGYKVYEFDILNISDENESWYGTISSLRYDALSNSGGTNKTDYLVFTDKLGVYKADITVENGASTATLSTDSVNCTIGTVTWNGSAVTIELVPADGYEFTTAEDVMAFATVNGEKCASASVDEDGVATVTYAFEASVEIGSVGENALKATVKFEKAVGNATVVVAVYDENGRFIAAAIEALDAVNEIAVSVDNTLGAKTVKAFAMGELFVINPLVASATANLE